MLANKIHFIFINLEYVDNPIGKRSIILPNRRFHNRPR